jgi:MFS family permease
VNSVYPARLAVKTIFFLNGFAHANYYGRLPRVQDLYHIGNGTMGVVLLSTALGAMLSMPFSGWLIIRNGSRKIGLFSVYMYCGLVPFIPIAYNLAGLVSVFFLLGVSAGMLDVAMNAQAVMIEQRWGKPIMTSFHAFFSIGMALGALTASFFSKIDTDLFTHLLIITIIDLVVITIARFYFLHDKPEKKQTEEPAFRVPTGALVGVGVIALCSMLGEGAMADWSTNYMENFAKASESLAPVGLAGFAFAMTIGRLIGDSARSKYGDRKLIVICGIISACGLTFAILLPYSYTVIAGFFIVGIGLSNIVPIAYSIAGNAKGLPPGVGIAMVTTVGYSGFFFGPPVMGFLSDLVTLRFAFLLVLFLFLVMTVLGYRYKQV